MLLKPKFAREKRKEVSRARNWYMINLLNIQREKLIGSELLCFLSSFCCSCLINNACDVNFNLTQMTNRKA